ncbi:MAG: DUF1820 family protein [Cardiobacteriaceae bacterium]|nr:DUF1820 family protein [Cardiobacteriaceae bacterium]
MNTEEKYIYRIQFKTEDKTYDLYVRNVYPSDMHGFVCIEGFLFLEEHHLVVDPRIEKLRNEFGEVQMSLIPYYQITRIDQVREVGESKVREENNSDKIRHFPTR